MSWSIGGLSWIWVSLTISQLTDPFNAPTSSCLVSVSVRLSWRWSRLSWRASSSISETPAPRVVALSTRWHWMLMPGRRLPRDWRIRLHIKTYISVSVKHRQTVSLPTGNRLKSVSTDQRALSVAAEHRQMRLRRSVAIRQLVAAEHRRMRLRRSVAIRQLIAPNNQSSKVALVPSYGLRVH